MNKILLKSVGVAGLLLTLSGCELPVLMAAGANDGKMTGMFEITFPAVMLIKSDDGTDEFLVGDLIGHVSGSAKFNFVGPTFGTCTGASSKSGYTTMSCENGYSGSFETGEQKPKMSGVNVVSGSVDGYDFVSAIGWGKLANENAVRSAVSEYQEAG